MPRAWFLDKHPSFSGASALAQKIIEWQTSATRIMSGGLVTTSWAADSAVSGGLDAAGRTFITGNVADRIRQDGWVRQVKASIFTSGTLSMKFKVFRPGSPYIPPTITVGFAKGSWVADTEDSSGALGRTFIDVNAADAVTVAGTLTQFRVSVHLVGATSKTIKFKIFRPNGANWDFVAETEVFTVVVGLNTFTTASPIAVQVGDILGWWAPGVGADRVYVHATNTGSNKYLDGDISGLNVDFTSTVANTTNVQGADLFLDSYSYTFVGESEVLYPPGLGEQTFDLAQPIPCQCGDIPGVWLEGGGAGHVQIDTKTGGTALYAAGDIITGSDFDTTVLFTLCIECLTNPPFLTVTGDSIPEGHNTINKWHSFYDNGPAGTITSEIMHQLRSVIGDGNILQYQNHAKGSQTWAWVATTGIVSANETRSKFVLIHCGVNDVSAGRSWADIEANLNTVKAALTHDQILLVDEILPWTAGSDAQAAVIRTYNPNYQAWCIANGAYLIPCHDAMGQIRISTGELDDMLTANNYDGVHLAQPGINQMGEDIWYEIFKHI